MGLHWDYSSFNLKSDSVSQRSELLLKAAPGAGFSYYITDIVIAGGGTARAWQVRNGSADLFVATVAANTIQSYNLIVPLKVGSNSSLTLTTAGASASSSILVHGFVDRG